MASKLSRVGAVIRALLPILAPIVTDEICCVWGVDDEVEQLQKTLEAIQGAITDAENQHADRENIKLWLRDLKDIAYDAHDILDEYAYESLRVEISTRKLKQLRDFFSSSNFIILGYKMGKKIKNLKKKLVRAGVSKNLFHHSENIMNILSVPNTTVSNIGQTGRETLSYETSEIVGRERAASDVIKLLINSFNNREATSSSIFRIVGMGGVGKTALAQIIYNNNDIVGRFQEKSWICISQHSNQKKIFNQLLESLLDRKCDESSGLDVIVKKLTIGLKYKRYLIVLDDMWNNEGNQWEDMLKTLLHIGAQGSKVIVTTRSNEVLASMTSSLYNYNLVGLSDEDCWVLLEKIAFGLEGVQKPAGLIEIGKRIAKKCGGVPLAIRVLGCLMYKQRTEEDWRSIENNSIWNLPVGKEKIINVLKLSYDHLEPNLKQCFAYCSLFPKDHIIKKKTLAQLWLAEGFLSSAEPNTEMDVAERYFVSLLRNSFFQDAKENDMGNVKSCKMHILVHDLAQFLSKTDCSIMNVNQIPKQKLGSLRRISLFTDENNPAPLPEFLCDEGRKIRAFVCTSTKFVDNVSAMGHIFKNFSHLRVLDLSYYPNDELPPSIESLKYLRYLNLSNSQLTKLPNSITTLYHLQILILKNCFELKVLPRDMSKLKNLRHLIICRSKTVSFPEWIPPMPRKVRELINLQYLPVFTVGDKKHGFGIQELSTLNLLGGKLHVLNLENVSTKADAGLARIGEKKHIIWLKLHWEVSDHDVVGNVKEVLQGLQPHRSLKKLGIYNYASSNFSTWMMNLSNLLPNLVNIVLENCVHCEELPPLGLLPFLKVLEIKGFLALKRIGREFFVGNNSSVYSFPCLKYLSICHMYKLEEWNYNISESSSSFSSSFPVLEKLEVKFCPGLRIMPTRISSLKELEIESCIGQAEAISSLVERNLKSLTSVSIKTCEELVFLPPGLLNRNYILDNLVVKECYKFEGFTEHIFQDFIMEDRDVQGLNIAEIEILPEASPKIELPETEILPEALPKVELSEIEILPEASPKIELPKTEILPEALPNVELSEIEILPEALPKIEFPETEILAEALIMPKIEESEEFGGTVLQNLSLLNSYCGSFKSLPSGIENLSRLRLLELGGFSEELDSFPFPAANIIEGRIVGDYFSSLCSLKIYGWSKLNCLPGQFQYLTSLQILDICKFGSLEVLPEWLGNMASLQKLILHSCLDLVYMPSREQMLRLTSLQELEIKDCPLLADRCRGGGEEHYKITNIPNVKIGPESAESDQRRALAMKIFARS